MSPDDPSAGFRRNATRGYKAFVAFLVAVAVGILALGWWVGRWWGLAGGAAVAAVVVVGGLIAGTLLWAMTQDGG
jgi:hypothetical protein